MISLLQAPVTELVERYAPGFALARAALAAGVDDCVVALRMLELSDHGGISTNLDALPIAEDDADQPAYLIAAALRRHVGPRLRQQLRHADMDVELAVHPDRLYALRLHLLGTGVAIPVRKRPDNAIEDPCDVEAGDGTLFMTRPGRLTLLWEIDGDHLSQAYLARVDPNTYKCGLLIFEQATLPLVAPQRAGVTPDAAANEHDSLAGLVSKKKDEEAARDEASGPA